jgi:hypothetical protein
MHRSYSTNNCQTKRGATHHQSGEGSCAETIIQYQKTALPSCVPSLLNICFLQLRQDSLTTAGRNRHHQSGAPPVLHSHRPRPGPLVRSELCSHPTTYIYALKDGPPAGECDLHASLLTSLELDFKNSRPSTSLKLTAKLLSVSWASPRP